MRNPRILLVNRMEQELQLSPRALLRGLARSRPRDDLLSTPELVRTAAELGTEPVDYAFYCTARAHMTPLVTKLLSATTFSQFPRSVDERVAPLCVLRFIREAMVLKSCFRRLSAYDATGDGFLREHELENYIFEAIPAVPQLAALQENFYPFYVFTAVRRFFFFLDSNKTGQISIRSLISSQIFSEWIRILPPGHPDLGPCGCPIIIPPEGVPLDDSGWSLLDHPSTAEGHDAPHLMTAELRALLLQLQPPSPHPANWFSASSALRVYSQYLQLDADQNGMLSPHELAGYAGGAFTYLFVQRVFEECHTYGGEADYKAYLDVVLAAENRASHASLRFFFKLLDVKHQGYLTLEGLRLFFCAVNDRLSAAGHESMDTGNVCDEVFDMVAPAAAGQISLEDLKRCRAGGVVCGILLDVAAFIAYDRREETKVQGGAAVDEELYGGDEYGRGPMLGTELAGGYAVGGFGGADV